MTTNNIMKQQILLIFPPNKLFNRLMHHGAKNGKIAQQRIAGKAHLSQKGAISFPLSHLSSNSLLHYFTIFCPIVHQSSKKFAGG